MVGERRVIGASVRPPGSAGEVGSAEDGAEEAVNAGDAGDAGLLPLERFFPTFELFLAADGLRFVREEAGLPLPELEAGEESEAGVSGGEVMGVCICWDCSALIACMSCSMCWAAS